MGIKRFFIIIIIIIIFYGQSRRVLFLVNCINYNILYIKKVNTQKSRMYYFFLLLLVYNKYIPTTVKGAKHGRIEGEGTDENREWREKEQDKEGRER